MKRKGTGKGIMAIGSLRTDGITTYMKQGRLKRCSPQTIVTRCTLYKQYTTEDALETAADSYGGLTDRCMP